MVTPGVYGLVSGGAHSSGTFMNLSKSSNMFTTNTCALSNLYPFVFSLASSASYNSQATKSIKWPNCAIIVVIGSHNVKKVTNKSYLKGKRKKNLSSHIIPK